VFKAHNFDVNDTKKIHVLFVLNPKIKIFFTLIINLITLFDISKNLKV
jgi:hypothetical protein